MKNFLFGRGAACTSCATCPTAAPACAQPPRSEPVCGYEPACGYETAPVAPMMADGCHGANCNSGTRSYMPSGFDPYAGNVYDPYAHSGEVIGSQVMGDSSIGYPSGGSVVHEGMVPGSSYPSGVVGDNFDARSGTIMSAPVPMNQ